MVKEYLRYCYECFRLSYKPAWRGAETTVGNLLSAFVSIVLARYLAPWVQRLFKGEDVQELITWVVGIVVFVISFLVLRIFLVAPFQLYRRQQEIIGKTRSEKERLRKELDDLVNGDIPDLSFGDAIDLIRESFPEKNVPEKRIAEQIVELAFRETISAWGQPPLFESMLPMANTPVKIPHQFFYSPNYSPTEDGEYLFEVFTNLPGWSDWQKHGSYLNVMVNRGQVLAAFSNKTDA